NVGLTWPPLRPDAPHPGSCASSTQTDTPACAKCSAVDKPVNPPPITSTSQPQSSRNGGVAAATGAVAAQSDCAAGYESMDLTAPIAAPYEAAEVSCEAACRMRRRKSWVRGFWGDSRTWLAVSSSTVRPS